MTPDLFVYGTLAPGRPNGHVLAEVSGRWEPAHVRGTLVEHGRGAALGFPAIELDVHGDVVEGLLFTSEVLDEHWARLDEFEGDGYERVLTKAVLPTGHTQRPHRRAPSSATSVTPRPPATARTAAQRTSRTDGPDGSAALAADPATATATCPGPDCPSPLTSRWRLRP